MSGVQVDFIVLGIIYFLIFFRKWKDRGMDHLIVNTLMYVYISLVLYVTLMPIVVSLPYIFNHSYTSMHMRIFEDLILGRGDALRQIVLNVVMMIPFGFLLPIVKKQNIWSCILWTFLFSLSIELFQPLINGYRSSDATDLVTNTTGGMIGYLLYVFFKPFIETTIETLKGIRAIR
ncbi:VanZ family protein [Fervidibacillus halotolerans]|uniref:VanZ family protein n=1 Tax=Fervidibacillus halotolerans TaxID=2980027 RepID=A0A9E8M0I4_9BACI|nr:VanZ family protein [Fervidibacillus halotolerans]WAA12680.1 VanZ family protein [Fervidibacillus halotolerans]